MIAGSKRRHGLYVLAFLLPNLLGFLIFTAGPVAGSLVMSVTDWSLTEHNAFSDEPIRFVGIDNYESILVGSESERFWPYLGNTLYLMIGIPLGIAGSLGASLLITANLTPTKRASKVKLSLLAVAVGVIATGAVFVLTWPGPPPAEAVLSAEAGVSDMTAHEVAKLRCYAATLATAGVGVLAVLGVALGSTFFRTTFYLPSLLAGVPMFLLWKALYRPDGGLINAMLGPPLDAVHAVVVGTPEWLGWIYQGAGGALALGGLAWSVWLIVVGARRLSAGDVGGFSFVARVLLVATMFAVLLGVAIVLWGLPASAAEAGAEGFDPPAWLVSSTWAKPALVIMGVWLGVGGANMLLYIAGISNIPPELYEAVDIDGAGPWQRFINVTWPQLAPTTFFIVIMSTIAGLQGGFEQALIMTGGQYDTTVLTYYIYNLAFTDNFELGLASAVAWVMFAMVFGMTVINYRLGSRLTNE